MTHKNTSNSQVMWIILIRDRTAREVEVLKEFANYLNSMTELLT
jgi:hypothetical protein